MNSRETTWTLSDYKQKDSENETPEVKINLFPSVTETATLTWYYATNSTTNF